MRSISKVHTPSRFLGLRLLLALVACWLCLLPARSRAENLPVPTYTAKAMDSTGTLTPDELSSLSAKLAQYERAHGYEIVALMVPTSGEETAAAYSLRIANQWEIGGEGHGSGALLFIAKDDHKTQLQLGNAVAHLLSDEEAHHILQNILKPQLQAGRFAAGMDAATAEVHNLLVSRRKQSTARKTWLEQLQLWGRDAPAWLAVLVVVLGGALALGIFFGSLVWLRFRLAHGDMNNLLRGLMCAAVAYAIVFLYSLLWMAPLVSWAGLVSVWSSGFVVVPGIAGFLVGAAKGGGGSSGDDDDSDDDSYSSSSSSSYNSYESSSSSDSGDSGFSGSGSSGDF